MTGHHAESQVPSKLGSLLRLIVLVILGVTMAWALRAYVIEPYEIPSGSMEDTIMVGDRVFAEKISLRFEPVKPGQIITFSSPEVAGRTLIKRCVAVGGQTVNFLNGHLVVDGQIQDVSYTEGKPSYPLEPARGVKISYPYTLKSDEVWVMGDNRTNSADSRYFGPIKTSSISGHAFCVFWPVDHLKVL